MLRLLNQTGSFTRKLSYHKDDHAMRPLSWSTLILFTLVGLHIMNFGLNSKTAFHTRVAYIYSCSVTADVICKKAREIQALMSLF